MLQFSPDRLLELLKSIKSQPAAKPQNGGSADLGLPGQFIQCIEQNIVHVVQNKAGNMPLRACHTGLLYPDQFRNICHGLHLISFLGYDTRQSLSM